MGKIFPEYIVASNKFHLKTYSNKGPSNFTYTIRSLHVISYTYSIIADISTSHFKKNCNDHIQTVIYERVLMLFFPTLFSQLMICIKHLTTLACELMFF